MFVTKNVGIAGLFLSGTLLALAGCPANDGADGKDASVAPEKFSFFVTSLKALQDLSGSQLGFGGDLRFGETGPGAGLRGADKICSTIAERSMPGADAHPHPRPSATIVRPLPLILLYPILQRIPFCA